jgi:hypothetical protein
VQIPPLKTANRPDAFYKIKEKPHPIAFSAKECLLFLLFATDGAFALSEKNFAES